MRGAREIPKTNRPSLMGSIQNVFIRTGCRVGQQLSPFGKGYRAEHAATPPIRQGSLRGVRGNSAPRAELQRAEGPETTTRTCTVSMGTRNYVFQDRISPGGSPPDRTDIVRKETQIKVPHYVFHISAQCGRFWRRRWQHYTPSVIHHWKALVKADF